MTPYLILCVDDEREVLDSVQADLSIFSPLFMIESAESVTEAKDVIQQTQESGGKLALILCDHIMPEQTGIDFLIELHQDIQTKSSKKILLTGQAGLDDTVQAINHASLDYFIAKPWIGDDFIQIITKQLTQYIIEHEDNLLPWAQELDTDLILDVMTQRRTNFSDS